MLFLLKTNTRRHRGADGHHLHLPPDPGALWGTLTTLPQVPRWLLWGLPSATCPWAGSPAHNRAQL